MQIFCNAGTDVFYETRPLVACCDLLLVDRNERLKDGSINCIINQEYSTSGF